MQIHELNDYNGPFDEGAFVVVDNGSDTGKAPVPSILQEAMNAIAAANARINNIIAGGAAPSEAEIIDARLGGNGVSYPSLGDSIRGQYNELNADLYALSKSEDLSWLALEHNGYYLKNDDTITQNSVLAYTDYIEIPDGAVAVQCGNKVTSAGVDYNISPNILFYDENKSRLSIGNSYDEIATYSFVGKSKYIRVNQPARNASGKALIRFVFDDQKGYVGKSKVTFSSTPTGLNSLIYLKANTPYTIINKTEITAGRVNAFADPDTTHLVRIYQKGAVEFTPAVDGWLRLFNAGGAVTGEFEIEVYESSKMLAKLRRSPTVYEVGPTKAITSLTELLYSLKNDDAEKIIYVDGGDYDIFQEYTDLGLLSGPEPANPITDYFDYNVWVPSNTHIIGRGLVRLLWQPTTGDISKAWSKTISPLNVAGSATIENIEIHTRNGRYCIHDDPIRHAAYSGARKFYKNVKCYKYIGDTDYGLAAVIGVGIDREMYYEYDNCYFYSELNSNAFYMHNRASDEVGSIAKTASSNVVAKNCIMDTSGNGVKFGNVGSSSNLRIRVNFDSCYIGGQVLISDESDQALGNQPNTFDVTLLRCNNPTITVRDATNPYPVKQF